MPIPTLASQVLLPWQAPWQGSSLVPLLFFFFLRTSRKAVALQSNNNRCPESVFFRS